MSDQRPLLRAIFDAAVAAAHPDVVLSAHLRPAPKGRVICLAAGKAAAAMAAADLCLIPARPSPADIEAAAGTDATAVIRFCLAPGMTTSVVSEV